MLAKGSLPWILIPLILALISIFLFIPIAPIFLLIILFFGIFFRDPNRRVGVGIVSPADGKISSIEDKSDNVRISIIMGLGNVHVNRAPMKGKVKNIEHHKGKHIPAFDKNSEMNERVIITLKTSVGQVKLVQIAGAFARRIKTYIRKGDKLSKGQRIGMIRFGSRVDIYLPKNRIRVLAKVGIVVRAGESCLAVEGEDED